MLSFLPSSVTNTLLKFNTTPKLIKFSSNKLIGHSPSELYSIISNVNDYSNFIPWCTKSVVTKNCSVPKEESVVKFKAELGIGFNSFQEKYTSLVICEKDKSALASNSTLFTVLNTTWTLDAKKNTNSKITNLNFDLEFKFKNVIYSNLSQIFLDKVSLEMIKAFEERAKEKFGKPTDLNYFFDDKLNVKVRNDITENRKFVVGNPAENLKSTDVGSVLLGGKKI
ncbi:Coenzyme Q-binding protein COQ10 B, mitochondrial [Clydaea vesicula]|uniref:Coenzyme Q-binding protein COQ10 B, mitochondrial n=1 Tax=Clydaea vesicula TaxID=447962 RepID=A0AAD5XVG5_9FUNG|nr:Coenzyme Q-binding protein COQ10 B, mitochondrial [Clydaea vesicula]